MGGTYEPRLWTPSLDIVEEKLRVLLVKEKLLVVVLVLKALVVLVRGLRKPDVGLRLRAEQVSSAREKIVRDDI